MSRMSRRTAMIILMIKTRFLRINKINKHNKPLLQKMIKMLILKMKKKTNTMMLWMLKLICNNWKKRRNKLKRNKSWDTHLAVVIIEEAARNSVLSAKSSSPVASAMMK